MFKASIDTAISSEANKFSNLLGCQEEMVVTQLQSARFGYIQTRSHSHPTNSFLRSCALAVELFEILCKQFFEHARMN